MTDQPEVLDQADEGPPSGGGSGLRSALEWVAVIGGAVLVALLIKTFLLQAFYIPSESMEPTLVKDDRVLVNKLAYRVGDPSRGDVVVFEKPETDVTALEIKDLIKRVIGLPGESVVIQDGAVWIDGDRLEEPYLTEGTVSTTGTGTTDLDGVVHLCTMDDPCVVPDGYVFVMGDNRTNSRDSRFREVGFIDQDAIVGKAFVLIWPLDHFGGL